MIPVRRPVLNHFDHGQDEQHVEGDTDVDQVGLDPSGLLQCFISLGWIRPRSLLDRSDPFTAVPVINIVCRGSGHDAPDKTHGNVAGQVGRDHRTEGVDQRMDIHLSVEKPEE